MVFLESGQSNILHQSLIRQCIIKQGILQLFHLPEGIKNNDKFSSLGKGCYECARMRAEFDSLIDNAYNWDQVYEKIWERKKIEPDNPAI